jgi:hypothetical protein
MSEMSPERLAEIRDYLSHHTVPRLMMRTWRENGPGWPKNGAPYRDYSEWAWLTADMAVRDLLAHIDHLTAERDAALADAWDRGYTSGHSNAMRRMSDEPDAPTSPNPYRP